MATPIAMALSKLEEVKQRLQDPMDKKTELISYWINTDTAACWMTLIHQLDIIEETKLVETVKPSTQRRKGIYIYNVMCTVLNTVDFIYWKDGS